MTTAYRSINTALCFRLYFPPLAVFFSVSGFAFFTHLSNQV